MTKEELKDQDIKFMEELGFSKPCTDESGCVMASRTTHFKQGDTEVASVYFLVVLNDSVSGTYLKIEYTVKSSKGITRLSFDNSFKLGDLKKLISKLKSVICQDLNDTGLSVSSTVLDRIVKSIDPNVGEVFNRAAGIYQIK